MTDEPEPQAAARLRAVAVELVTADDRVAELQEERSALMAELADAGLGQRALADLAGTSRENVKFILQKRRARASAATAG